MFTQRQHDKAAVFLWLARLRFDDQPPRRRVLPQQKSQRARDRRIGKARQRVGDFDDAPDPANVGKRDEQCAFMLGAAEARHQEGFPLSRLRERAGVRGVSARRPYPALRATFCLKGEKGRGEHQALDDPGERFERGRFEQARQSRRLLDDQTPEIRRMVGEAEQEIAHRRRRCGARERRCVRLVKQLRETFSCACGTRQARRGFDLMSEA